MSKAKSQEQKSSKMVNEVEDTIIHVCKRAKQEHIGLEQYPQTVEALVELVLARAALR